MTFELANKPAEKVGAGGTAALSVAKSVPKIPMSLGDVPEIVTKAVAQLPKPPRVEIVETVSEIPVAAGAPANTKGLVFKGTVYIVSSTHGTAVEVEGTIWHELLHYGLRAFMSKQQFIDKMHELLRYDA